MRMSNIEDVQSQLAALMQENDFPTSDVAWMIFGLTKQEKRVPFIRKNMLLILGLPRSMLLQI